MKMRIVLLFLTIGMYCSCDKEKNPKSEIYGNWNLLSGYGTEAGISIDYDSTSNWNFSQRGVMSVTNKYIGPFDFSPITGQYALTIADDKILSDAGHFYYEIRNDTLSLDYRHADGISFTLTKK